MPQAGTVRMLSQLSNGVPSSVPSLSKAAKRRAGTPCGAPAQCQTAGLGAVVV